MARHATRKTFLVIEASKPNGRCKWKIEGRPNGKRERIWFRTEREAKEAARDRNNQIAANGTQNVLSDSERVEAAESFRALAPYGKTLRDAVAFYRDYLDRSNSSIPLAGLIEKVKDEWYRERTAGEIQPREYQTRNEVARKLLGSPLKDTPSKLFDGNEYKRWLATTNLNPRSRNKHLSYARSTIFKKAIELGFIKDNPMTGVTSFNDPTKKSRRIVIFSPGEVEKFLRVVDPDFIPFFTIAAFTGLRVEEVRRLDWSEVKLDRDLIDLPKEKSKNKRRKLIEIPTNLKAWLLPHEKAAGQVHPKKKLQLAREEACEVCKVDWRQNALRHSFVSYAVAERGVEWTERQADHSRRMLEDSYLEVVTKEEAAKYWAIYPKPAKPEPTDKEQEAANVITYINYRLDADLAAS